MDFAAATLKRDRRLRKRLLSTLHYARSTSPTGELSGRTLADVVASAVPRGQAFEDDGHALGLMRDLVNKGLATERLLERRRGQAFGLDYVAYKISARGSSLIQESIAPDPDVDDERLAEDE